MTRGGHAQLVVHDLAIVSSVVDIEEGIVPINLFLWGYEINLDDTNVRVKKVVHLDSKKDIHLGNA